MNCFPGGLNSVCVVVIKKWILQIKRELRFAHCEWAQQHDSFLSHVLSLLCFLLILSPLLWSCSVSVHEWLESSNRGTLSLCPISLYPNDGSVFTNASLLIKSLICLLWESETDDKRYCSTHFCWVQWDMNPGSFKLDRYAALPLFSISQHL